ncbi:MAG: NfeD family protein [Hyphomonadaceae bacterium]|nr:NfeD family protein [Hyphomonadaceae bacterium]
MDANSFVNLAPWHWLVVALVFLAAELMTGSTYLLWPAAAAVLAALAAWLLPGAPAADWALFGAASIALTLMGPRYVRGRWLNPRGDDTLNDRAREMVGAKGEAADAFVNGLGAVKLGDTVWRATASEPIAAGERVEVVSVSGATVAVRRAASMPQA